MAVTYAEYLAKQNRDSTDSNNPESNNKVGVIESMLSGIVSGAIAIPKGFFSLGASLLDIGSNTGKAAAVEQWFDDLTEFDEKAEATAAGKITELLVNIGIPGGLAFKGGANLAKSAMLAKQNGTYVKLTDPKFLDKAGKSSVLTSRGKALQFGAAALAGGVAEGAFVGDVKEVGSFGDLLGGPTKINRDEDDNAVTEILNRVKFGTEGALFTGLIGGTGKVIKKITNRNKRLDVANSRIDRWIDNIASKLRARSGKTKEFFDIERTNIGERASDANKARVLSRDLDKQIDKLFPAFRTIVNKQTGKERNEFLKKVNDLLLSGKAQLDAKGVAKFGPMDNKLKLEVDDLIKKYAVDKKQALEIRTEIFAGLSTMRGEWSKLFSELGQSLSSKELKDFTDLFGRKFKDYLGSTYDIMQNQSIIPFMGYRPAAQAIEDAKRIFKQSAKDAGKPITDLQAEQYVADILKPQNIGLPKGMRMDRPSEIYFKIPDFFVNRTTLDAANKAKLTGRTGVPRVNIGQLKESDQEVFNRLFGKQQNPMQTMMGGMAKLSLITRRNLFYRDLIKKNDEVVEKYLKATDKQSVAEPMFARSDEEARAFFGNADYKRIDVIDPAQKLQVSAASGATTPFGDISKPYFARKAVAEALEETGLNIAGSGTLGRMYESLVLYPKATSQIAKTILSPVTHMRNFVSAGAFAAANGILPFADKQAIKQAYQALQTPLKGTMQQNALYQKLLKLGVVNSNVRLGDLSRLMQDVGFGETMTSDKGMRLLLKPLSKLKQVSQDLYTAEDDFWKIYSWAMEKKRMEKAFEKVGLTRGQFFKRADGSEVRLTEDFLEQEAADIVRNNIPNYDYVSDFVKGLRKLPIGNFVSFPAEIARTGTNIVARALREINEEIIIDGKAFKPFAKTGYTRLFGFGTTVAAIPMGTAAMFQALYDVTDEEREAIRRYAAKWSKNSTLLPIKQEDGTFKYIDFSHANAYDTLIRPIQSVINAVAEGSTDQNGMMDDFAKGMFTAMSEFGQPFISESIWTEAVLDIIARGGRTRDGFQIYSSKDTPGDRNSKIMAHLVKAQMPFSLNQLKRLDQSIESVDVITKGKFDKYGQEYEFGDEFQGLFGFRAVNINPERTLKYKVADYQRGSRDSKSLFTRLTLKGGPIEPTEVVDAYINANRALFETQKEFKQDLEAAQLLNISEDGFDAATDRVSGVSLNSVLESEYRPYILSPEVLNAFEENADKIGMSNPMDEAETVIDDLADEFSDLSLDLDEFPVFENPFVTQTQSNPVTGPNTLNLPPVDQQIMTQSQAANQFSNLTMGQKIRLLFPNG